jgi:hypothetical protein
MKSPKLKELAVLFVLHVAFGRLNVWLVCSGAGVIDAFAGEKFFDGRYRHSRAWAKPASAAP